MALTAQSLILYGFEVTALNRSLDFRAVLAETPRQATLTIGFYSLTSLLTEVARALTAADPTRTYTVTANRTLSGGTQNRVTIATNGSYLQLLFATGPRTASTCAPLLGFPVSDLTGTSLTGTSSAGTVLVPDGLRSYQYLSPDMLRKVFGNVNISASGTKEAVIFQVQRFWQVQFKYQTQTKVINEWQPFLTWAIQQRLLEFTPEVTSPTVFYEGTLESTTADGKGLGFTAKEMLPEFPFFYDLGIMKFRVKES